MLGLDSVNLVLVHVKPFGSDCLITECSPAPLTSNPKLVAESHDVKPTRHGIAIANRLLNLLRHHYDLSVTSITGIPMKVGLLRTVALLLTVTQKYVVKMHSIILRCGAKCCNKGFSDGASQYAFTLGFEFYCSGQ